MDEGVLMNACLKVAARTMLDSEVEGRKTHALAREFFNIAREHAGFLPSNADTNAVARAVLYMAHVHASAFLREDTAWFHNALNILLELIFPSPIQASEATAVFFDIEKGIEMARRHLPDDRFS